MKTAPTISHDYTITPNDERNGIEITFAAKPSEAVREALKALKFRWHSAKKLWYGRAAAEIVKAAIEAAEAGTDATTETKSAAKDVETPRATRTNANKPDQDHVRIYYNGIKIDGGKLIRCGYSLDNNRDHAPIVSIYARDYSDLPRDLLPVENNSDIYTDYFEKDSARITPAHPLYKYFRYAAERAADHDDRNYIKYCEKRLALPERWTGYHKFISDDKAKAEARIAARAQSSDPGQPTAADLAAIDRQAQEAENARKAAEHAADIARRERYAVRRSYRQMIDDTAAAYPLEDGAPRVCILWSEHPAFPEDSLCLSLPAADHVLKTLDELEVDKVDGYFKTKFALEWTDEDGVPRTYTERYDLGDGEGGLIAYIKRIIGYRRARCGSSNPDDIEARIEGERLAAILDPAAPIVPLF